MANAAIVTLAIGEKYRALGEVTHRSFREYAQRCGLDLRVVTEHSIGCTPLFEKMVCASLLKQYRRVLVIDTDVVIAPDCPDLLTLVPEDQFGAYAVSHHTNLHDSAIGLIQTHLRNIGWQRHYFNAGVMVASRQHQAMFDQRDPDFAVWNAVCTTLPHGRTFLEQTYFNYKLQQFRIPLFDFGYLYNHTLAPENSETRFGSHIVHCKGHRRGSRLKEVRRANFVLQRPTLRRMLVRSPALARAYDALP